MITCDFGTINTVCDVMSCAITASPACVSKDAYWNHYEYQAGKIDRVNITNWDKMLNIGVNYISPPYLILTPLDVQTWPGWPEESMKLSKCLVNNVIKMDTVNIVVVKKNPFHCRQLINFLSYSPVDESRPMKYTNLNASSVLHFTWQLYDIPCDLLFPIFVKAVRIIWRQKRHCDVLYAVQRYGSLVSFVTFMASFNVLFL